MSGVSWIVPIYSIFVTKPHTAWETQRTDGRCVKTCPAVFTVCYFLIKEAGCYHASKIISFSISPFLPCLLSLFLMFLRSDTFLPSSIPLFLLPPFLILHLSRILITFICYSILPLFFFYIRGSSVSARSACGPGSNPTTLWIYNLCSAIPWSTLILIRVSIC